MGKMGGDISLKVFVNGGCNDISKPLGFGCKCPAC